MKNQNQNYRGLGASVIGGEVYTFIHDQRSRGDVFIVQKSHDGKAFFGVSAHAKIVGITEPSDVLSDCCHFNVSSIDGRHYMVYRVATKEEPLGQLNIAASKDLINWEKLGTAAVGLLSGKIVPEYSYEDEIIMYAGGDALYVLATDETFAWRVAAEDVIADIPDDHMINVVDVKHIDEGIFVAYYISPESVDEEDERKYELHAALFHGDNPSQMIWKSARAMHDVHERRDDLTAPFGLALLDESFASYWEAVDGKIVLFHHSYAHQNLESDLPDDDDFPVLDRMPENPILAPRNKVSWESKGAFNPAAISVGGKIHLLYRAIGDHDVSVLGYAQTTDGVSIDKVLPYPVYIPRESFEGAPTPIEHREHNLDSPYMSGGGGWGGCEDPKLVRIDDRIYLTYVAYNGWGPPRLAMSWITVDDFLAHNWKWSKPVLISKPGVVDKSGCILPEKVNGKYVIFHRVFPDILVDYVDSLDDFDGKTFFLKGEYKIPLRDDAWDSGKASFGAPPIKTPKGWLVVYHATTGRQEWEGTDLRYKIGAMLLDLHNPSKVIARTDRAMLEPETHYENEGAKYGIAYPCGAVVKDETLYVYYGGSDEFTCVATADVDQLVDDLMAIADRTEQEKS